MKEFSSTPVAWSLAKCLATQVPALELPTSSMYPARMHNPHTTPLCQLVRIILNSSSSTSSPASWRVSFPPSAERRHTRSSYRTTTSTSYHRHASSRRASPRESLFRKPPSCNADPLTATARSTCDPIGIAHHRRLPVCARVMTASVQTPSMAARFSRAWKLTTASQFKWNGRTCGSACEVGGGGLQADELNWR